jgi:formate dehydrogenase major subunit
VPDERTLRMPNLHTTVQKGAVDKGIARSFPIILTSGRLVEYEGGGEETRSNKWLAELQQDMFVEINPADAAARGMVDGAWVWVATAPRAAVPGSRRWSPSASARRRLDALPLRRLVPGRRPARNYPQGTDPIVLGESVNTVTTYGYDP